MEGGLHDTRGILQTDGDVFGLTNLPATFQVMMNELLRDLINTRKVAAFIDDFIVGMDMEEGYDEIVAEIIRRLEENDLYMKLEKCK